MNSKEAASIQPTTQQATGKSCNKGNTVWTEGKPFSHQEGYVAVRGPLRSCAIFIPGFFQNLTATLPGCLPYFEQEVEQASVEIPSNLNFSVIL